MLFMGAPKSITTTFLRRYNLPMIGIKASAASSSFCHDWISSLVELVDSPESFCRFAEREVIVCVSVGVCVWGGGW